MFQKLAIFVGVGIAVLNTVLWFTTPLLREAVDASAGRLNSPDRPIILNGVQELLVYYDPWLARCVFPLVFTVGFACVPFLGSGPDSKSADRSPSLMYMSITSLLLVLLEIVWLFLIWVGVWCRGPYWIFFWPGEPWDPQRIENLNFVNLSEFFWLCLDRAPPDPPPGSEGVVELMWIAYREAPGILLMSVYFGLGFLFVIWAHYKRNATWRLAIPVVLLQLAIAVPIKMLCRHLFNLRNLVAVPEYFINI